MFLRLDTDGDGKLDHAGVAALARQLVASLRSREVGRQGGVCDCVCVCVCVFKGRASCF